MKCPYCGKEIEDDSKFCKYCTKRIENSPDNDENPDSDGSNEDNGSVNTQNTNGYASFTPPQNYSNQTPSKKSNFVRCIRALISVILYISVMFLCQSCVISGYTTSLMLESPGAYLDSFYQDSESAAYDLQYLVDKVNEKTVLILLISNLLAILIIFAFFSLRRKNPRAEISFFKINPFRYVSFALFGMALNVFVSVTISFLPIPEKFLDSFSQSYSSLYSGSDSMSLALEIFSVAVVAGIVEEIIFRGIALRRLLPLFGKFWSVIITSLLFGLAHGTPVAICYATALGLLFGAIFVRYNSIIPSILCHIFFNLTSYFITEVPDFAVVYLYIISIAVIILFSYRIFVRYPVFYDIFYDFDSVIPPVNEREKQIVARIREMQKTGDADPEELLNLNEDWEENRRRTKK